MNALTDTAKPDALIRRVDEDRWLASRFARRPARARLIALYALAYEIARTVETVSQEAIGDIRLAWWGEAVDEIYAGKQPRAHPIIEAYAAAHAEAPMARGPLDAFIAAHGKDFDAAPFEDWPDLEAYIDSTAGALMHLASAACADTSDRPDQFDALIRYSGRAWGYAGLMRALPVWSARNRSPFPRRLLMSHGASGETVFSDFSDHRARRCIGECLTRGRYALVKARKLAKNLPPSLFPALGYVALLPGYYQKLEGSGYDVSKLGALQPLLLRQLIMIKAAAFGAV